MRPSFKKSFKQKSSPSAVGSSASKPSLASSLLFWRQDKSSNLGQQSSHPLKEELKAKGFSKNGAKQRQRVFARRYMRQWGLFKGTAAGSVHYPSANHYGFAANNFAASMRYALEGLAFAFQHERNLRIDVALSALTVGLALYLHVALPEWVTLIQALGFVLVAELVNTVLEWLVDLLTEGRFDLRAKRIKDMAAAACLVVALCSFSVIGLVFWPYVKTLLF
jgi:diacylglycerol kinase